MATAIFEDRARENPGGTRVGGVHAGWLVSLPKAARNDLAAVLSPAEARASVTVGDEAGVPVDEHLAGA